MDSDTGVTGQEPEQAAHVLVVDDEATNRELLCDLLSIHGYETAEAEDGESALQQVGSCEPDTILLDVMMPGLDGFEVCRRLKADPATAPIPVLLVTALAGRQDRLTGIEAGANDFLTKPIDSQDVVLRVRNAVRLKRLYDQVRESYEKLRDLEHLRDNLTHMIVHDMRSPLTGLAGHLQLFEMDAAGKLNDDDREDLQNALTAANMLTDMVSSLLDVSRLESGEMPLGRSMNNLADVVTGAIENLGVLVRKCEVIREAPAEQVDAFCDADVTRRIVANLVANALKFAPEGGEVRIRVSRDDSAARIAVSDNGPGIPPEYLERIFEKFGQVDTRKTGTRYSTGLGLTFCKLATEAQGGDIGVQSVLGQGSTFSFTLPLGGAG